MTYKVSTKKALLMSLLSLLLCCSMLIGTTFAWFTDEVISADNVIKSGTLKAQLWYSDEWEGDTTAWNDASKGKIFNYQYWEPGYTDIKYIKVANIGDLAFQYQLSIIPCHIPAFGEKNLADVIDVYFFNAEDFATDAIGRDDLTNANRLGTLTELMTTGFQNLEGKLLPADGVGATDVNANEDANTPRGEVSFCIVLKMKESAGNEYQNLEVGGGFSVRLLATQYTWENDSIDHEYDKTDFIPKADVQELGPQLLETSTHGMILANNTFQFKPNQTLAEAQVSPYKDWHADFVVYADQDIPAEAVILPGYYKAYADYTGDKRWIGLSSSDIIPAGTQIRLVKVLSKTMTGNDYGVTVNYEEICRWGNDGTGFLCGVSDQSNGVLDGVTLTVELRLFETYTKEEAYAKFNDSSTNYEKADYEPDAATKKYYEVIGTYTHVFGKTVEVNKADQLKFAVEHADMYNKIKLIDDINLGDTQITVPAGKTVELDLNGHDITADYTGASAGVAMFKIKNGAKLTVKGEGDVTASTGFVTSNNYGAIFSNAGELVIEGGNYCMTDSTTGQTWIISCVIDNLGYDCDGTTTINGGTFTVAGKAKNIIRNRPQHTGTMTLIINDGHFKANPAEATTYIWNQVDSGGAGEIFFNGGTFDSTVVYEDYNGQSDIHIASGVIINAYSGNN